MMQSEALELITIARALGFGGVDADRITTLAWQVVLTDAGVSYDDAKQAVMHSLGPIRFIRVGDVIDAVNHANRMTPSDIASDVRAARALHLLPLDYPETQPVPDDVAGKLRQHRAETSAKIAELDAADRVNTPGREIDPGIQIREAPHG